MYRRFTIILSNVLFTHTVPFAAPVLNTSPQSTATSIIIAGSYPSGSVVSGFVVHWQKNLSIGCSDVGQQNIDERGRFSRYVITGVEPGNRYSIRGCKSMTVVKMRNLFVTATHFVC